MAMFPLGVLAELLINGTWQDISRYLYQRDGITITGGSVNWGDTPQPAQMTFTVNNRDGRFSPLYAAGAYYPYLTRNVQVRLTVTATSASGNFYSGYRFWGEVSEWPPLSDISGHDVYVQVTATGPLRRISARGGQGSALTRYYQSLPGAYAPVAYWTCEEDPASTGIIGAGVSGGTNMTVTTGTPAWKAVSDFNGSAPVAVLNNSTWDGLTGSFGTSGDDVFLVPGTRTWVASTTTVNAKVWGAGGGGENGYQGGPNAGGGGAFAQEATLAVTPGTAYTVVVGAGGAGGHLDNKGTNRDGAAGGFSQIQGDAVLVKAAGGKGGTSAAPGAGGAIGTNTVKFAGGAGGTGAVVGLFPPSGGGGGGGGGSAGTAANGNAGSNTSTGAGAAGGTAVTGGSAGGHGGSVSDDAGITPGGSPGGGGGAGAFDFRTGAGHSGQSGGNGKVELIYTPTPTTLPNSNVIRFILLVPKHGGNNNRVLLRVLTSGTVAQLDVLYQAGGKLYLKGYNNAATLLFTSGTVLFGDGQTVMVDAELANSGSNVQWFITTIVPGSASIGAFSIGTVAGSVGNVTEVLAGPNADVSKTAIGHISVQYAVIPVARVSQALNGHLTELGIDRFIRLANEQAMDNVTEFAEQADHWGFELASYANAWVATNATRAQSAVTAGTSGTPWSFACNGTPLDTTYFIATNAQAAGIQSGDQFNDVLNPGKIFTVQAIGGAFAGFNNVSFTPAAKVIMDSTDTVTQILAQRLDPAFPAGWPTDGSHSLLITSSGGAGEWYATSPTGTSGQPVLPGDIVSLGMHFYTPAVLGFARPGILWYNAAGTLLSTTNGTSLATTAGQIGVMAMTAAAPATAAFFAVKAGDNETAAAGKLLYIDNVRVSPQMGVQTRREYAAFLREIRHLDQGILKEAKTLWGLGYRTRLAMINQAPAVTLDYSAGTISPPLAPVVDLQKVTNHIVVRRHGGSKITVTLDTGTMSTQEPPAGVGRMKTIPPAYIAAVDGQLAALAAHLLNLGTDPNERYPTITVNLARASIPGNALAPLMSAVAGTEIGDYVQLTNLPFWFPNATAKQLVIGYTETINAREWTITWNCTPEAPWEIVATALRRW